MKNTYRSTILKIVSGESEAEANVSIPSGERIIVLASDGGVSTSSLTRIKIEEAGSEVHPFQSHKVYDGSVGSFSQRGIEIKRREGGDFTIRAKSVKPVTEDTFFEVNFLIQSNESCD